MATGGAREKESIDKHTTYVPGFHASPRAPIEVRSDRSSRLDFRDWVQILGLAYRRFHVNFFVFCFFFFLFFFVFNVTFRATRALMFACFFAGKGQEGEELVCILLSLVEKFLSMRQHR